MLSRVIFIRRTIMCFNGFAQSLALKAVEMCMACACACAMCLCLRYDLKFQCASFHLISDCIEANSNENRFMSKSVRIYLPISDLIFLCASAAAAGAPLLCCAWREIFFYYDSVLFHFNFPHDNIQASGRSRIKMPNKPNAYIHQYALYSST